MAEDPYSKYGGSVASLDPYAKYGGSAADIPPSRTAGHGRTGERLKGDPEDLPDTFMGTLTKDFASLPAAAYGMVRHPIDAEKAAFRSVAELPADLARDIKDGKYGKISARVLELIIPGLGGGAARDLATSAAEAAGRMDSAAGRAAARVSGSKIPEAIGGEIRSAITPDIVARIRARLHPEPPSPSAPEPFRPNPNIARTTRFGGPAERSFSSAPPRSGRIVKPSGKPLTPQPKDPPTPKAPEPFRPNPNITRRWTKPSSPAGASSGMPSAPARTGMRGRTPLTPQAGSASAPSANSALVKSVEEAAKKAGATEADIASAIAQASAKSVARGGKRLRSLSDLSTDELQQMHRELTGPSGPPSMRSLRIRRRKAGQ